MRDFGVETERVAKQRRRIEEVKKERRESKK